MTTQLQPLPTEFAFADGWYGSASAFVAPFLQRLRCLPASVWVDEGVPRVELMRGQQGAFAARRRLHDALASMPHVVARIRTRVNADLAVFHGLIAEPALRRMRRAAHLAAFALAAHEQLDAADVELFYRPFADVIPPPKELRSR